MLTAPRGEPALATRAVQSIALLLLLALTNGAHAERLPIKAYTTADGLVNNRIGRVVSDSHGFLWFCTSNGVSRFDGSRFKNYGVDDGLPIGATYDLLETRKGTYWVATNGGGVTRFTSSGDRLLTQGETPSRFTVYSLGDTPVANRVNKLFEDRSGTIWAGTDGGLFSLNEAQGESAFHSVELGVQSHPDLAVQVWDFVENSDGSLWIATKFGLMHRLADGRMIYYEVDPSPVSDVIFSLIKDNDDNLWMTHNTGVFVCKFSPGTDSVASHGQSLKLPGGVRHFTTADGLGGNNTTAVFKSKSGPIWIADTSPAITEFDGKSFRSYPLKQFVGTDPPNSIAEDNDGNLWIGTGANGVLRFARKGFVTYGASDGLGEYVISIFENHARELIVSTRGWILNRFDGRAFAGVKINLPRSVTEVGVQRSSAAIIEDHNGEYWVGTRVGLYRFAKIDRLEEFATARPKAIYTHEQGLASDDISSLFEDSRGDIWISNFAPGRDVLTRWERRTETFHRYSEGDGLRPFTSPSSFAEDRAGNIWIGIREGGLARYVNGSFVVFGEADGFPQRSAVSVYLDQFGRLWCTLFEGRVCRIDHPEVPPLNVVQYTRKDGIGNQLFSSIVADDTGRIYVGGPQDITQIDPATGHIKHFTPTDGLGIGDAARAFRDRQGSLWFGGSRGLSRYAPEPERDRLPPPIYIDELRIAGLSHQVSPVGESVITGLVMQPNQNNIQIDFFGLSFGLGESLRYQYRLEGSSADWSAPDPERSVNYANLAPGAYRFLVRAVNSEGVASESPAVVDFRILPPVWRRWWFLFIASMLVAGVGFAFARSRLARLKAVGESERRFRILAETASDAIITIDEQGRIVYVNPAAEKVFGHTQQKMIDAELTMLMPEYLRHLHQEGFTRYQQTGTRHISWEAIELPGLHRNGSEIPLELSFAEFVKDDQRYFTGIARDISERKRAEAERLEAAEALQRSREERLRELERVRRRIATDLHDDIGSSLTRISLLSEVVQRQGDGGLAPASKPLTTIAQTARELVDAMSDIVWAINPQKDHLSDLTQRMRRFASDVLTARSIEFRFRAPDHDRDANIGANCRREFFLIFKEAVNNVVRHSRCATAEIEFRMDGDALFLQLSDDGRGFDVAEKSDGHGLASMRERTEALGGGLDVVSRPGSGTTLTFTIPLVQGDADATVRGAED